MILSDKMIRAAIAARDIVIEPFDEKALGTNSYDVHLSETLKTYVPNAAADSASSFKCKRCHAVFSTWNDYGEHSWTCTREGPTDYIREDAVPVLDCKVEPNTVTHKISPRGFVLRPEKVYLGVTQEYTETHKHVPFLDGKSSIGRLGITIHCTAGRGDVGFCNHWTLEIHVQEPVRVYAGMPIGQLIYFETGDVAVPYNKKPSAKYNTRCAEPQASQMWKNFEREHE